MSHLAKIFKNTGILMMMELGTRAMDALVAVILARYLAPEGFGLLAFALSFAWVFSILSGFGMGALIVRNVSRDPGELNRYLANSLVAKIFLGLATLIIMVLTCWLLRYPADKCWLVFWAALLMIVDTNMNFLLSFFQSAQRMMVMTLVNLSVRLGWIGVSLWVIAFRGGVNELVQMRLAVTLIGFIAAFFLIHFRLQRIHWHFEPAFMLQILKASFPFALFRVYGQVYTDVDTVMLSSMRGDLMTGWYAAAHKILRLFTFIPTSFFGGMLPTVSRISKDRVELEKICRRSIHSLLAVALPIAGCACVVSEQIILLCYGEAYREAIPAFRILIWSIVFTFVNSGMVATLAAVNREKAGSLCSLLGGLLSCLSNFIVIPLFGYLGAAATTLLAEGLIFVFQLGILRREISISRLLKGAMTPLLSALVMVLLALLVKRSGLVTTLLGSGITYVLGLLFFSRWDPEFSALFFRRGKKPTLQMPEEDRKTVMFLETSLRIGGTETVVSQLVRSLDPRKFRPIVCCLYESGTLGEKLIQEGYPVFSELARHRFDLRTGVRLWQLMRSQNVKILFIVNQPFTQLWGVLCGMLARVPVRMTAIRSTGKINRIHRRLFLNRLTFPWIQSVTVLSETHKKYLFEKEKIPLLKMQVVPNGVDLKRFSVNGKYESLRPSFGIPFQEPVVGIVAMLRPEKNHALFLRVAAKVLRSIPPVHFLVVGDGPERDPLQALAKSLGIETQVRFVGARNDIPQVISLFDVAVLCSHPVVETLSNAVLEYMAAAKPVVATRVGSLEEQIGEGKTGYLVEPGDEEAMAERILKLLQDKALAREMGAAGRRKAEAQYSLEVMMARTESLFEKLLNEASQS